MGKIYPEIDERLARVHRRAARVLRGQRADRPGRARELLAEGARHVPDPGADDASRTSTSSAAASRRSRTCGRTGASLIMFCAFEGPPKSCGCTDAATTIEPSDAEFAELLAHFDAEAGHARDRPGRPLAHQRFVRLRRAAAPLRGRARADGDVGRAQEGGRASWRTSARRTPRASTACRALRWTRARSDS